jgi:hypothetical protein
MSATAVCTRPLAMYLSCLIEMRVGPRWSAPILADRPSSSIKVAIDGVPAVVNSPFAVRAAQWLIDMRNDLRRGLQPSSHTSSGLSVASTIEPSLRTRHHTLAEAGHSWAEVIGPGLGVTDPGSTLFIILRRSRWHRRERCRQTIPGRSPWSRRRERRWVLRRSR